MGGAPAFLVDTVLSRAWVRAVVILLWLFFIIDGLRRYRPFHDNLVTGSSAPAGSQSAVASNIYSEYFGQSPLTLTIMAMSLDGTPIINTTRIGSPFAPYGTTYLTAAASNASAALEAIAAEQLNASCVYTFTSFWQQGSDDPRVASVVGAVLERQLFDVCSDDTGSSDCVNASSTIYSIAVTSCDGQVVQDNCVSAGDSWCDPIADASTAFRNYANDANAATGSASSGLQFSVISFPDIVSASLQGVDETMKLSTMTAPIALALLGIMLRNVRQLLLTLANIFGCILASVVIMDPIAANMQVSSQAPALMGAVGLAMSIDYSLFLLSRFNVEVHVQRRDFKRALQLTLETSGHTVLVSGSTLCLCFLGMLLIPVSSIRSMGIAAALTVVFAIFFSLLLTPTLLLTCPRFFTANRRFGLNFDNGCCCSKEAPAARQSLILATSESLLGAEALPKADLGPTGLWARLGSVSQAPLFAVVLLVACVAIGVPFAFPLSQMNYVEGVLPTMPRGDYTTVSFTNLLNAFGVSSIFPEQLVITPPSNTSTSDTQWLNATCLALQEVAAQVTAQLASEGCSVHGNPCTMSASDFQGVMILGGYCVAELLGGQGPPIPIPPEQMTHALGALQGVFDNTAHTATKISVSTLLDPFSTSTGQPWLRALRDQLNNLNGEFNGIQIGSIYFTSTPLSQMDAATDTFKSLPRVIGATLVIVCFMLLFAFKSVFMPLRAVLCLLWMLVVTFGSAVGIYQDGWLDGLGWGSLQPVSGGLFWMSPCIAFSIVVGLGLDYDIFFMESVAEFYDEGHGSKTAVIKGLEQTGNIICVAGLIMFVAFGALVLGNSPTLNQIGYLLCMGVLLDCFVTTKVIIPCAMALMPGDGNFWPRKRQKELLTGAQSYNSGLLPEPLGRLASTRGI